MPNIKTSFSILYGTIILFLAAIFIAFLLLFQNRSEFGESQFNRTQVINLSDKIRERNENLTHYCMQFIITQDTVWEKAYLDLIYINKKTQPNSKTTITSIADSLSHLGLNKREQGLLQKTILISHEITQLEKEIFSIIKSSNSQGDIESDAYLIARDKALSIISSDEYISLKRKLIREIKQFEQIINNNTNEIWIKNISEGMRLYYLVLILIALVLTASLLAFYLIYKKLKEKELLDKELQSNFRTLEHTQDELLKSDERFTLAVIGAEAIIWDYNVKDQSVNWHPKDCNLLEYTSSEIESNWDFLISKIHRDDKERFENYINSPISESGAFNIEARFYTKNNELRWYRCKGSSSKDEKNNTSRIVGVFADITEHVLQDEKMMNTILETEDKERSRIAREIHDSLQQTMSTALLSFEKVRSIVRFTDDMAKDRFQQGYDYLKESINESRSLAHKLMPKVVDQRGVAPAIEDLINLQSELAGTTFSFYHNLKDERIKVAAEMTIYRIVQEAINNVNKHAKAESCTIQLLKHKNIITLTIEDDGQGFDLDKNAGTFGLTSMQTRANLIGGFLQIESSVGNGTQVLFELSL
ncbi:sensor histidine kinase [Saccharicrinis aurantiacus]|uniref:sensor histidine kinase n=1 Tax=Saccharicrinis aurantiacus TaxID=1849719 RepID=UPI000950128C|nr:PAS domain-containing protein [Saccharicrinis aurantiacus]